MKGLCQSDYLGTRVSGKLGRLSKTIDWSAHIRVLGSVCTVEFFMDPIPRCFVVRVGRIGHSGLVDWNRWRHMYMFNGTETWICFV